MIFVLSEDRRGLTFPSSIIVGTAVAQTAG